MAKGKKKAPNRGDYDVGYGRPPAATRFKKGRSGNPKGRPRGSKDFLTVLDQAFDEKVTVQERGRERPQNIVGIRVAVAGDHQVAPQPRKLGGNGLAEPRSAARHEDTAPAIGSCGQGQRSYRWRLWKSSLLGHVQLPV